MQRGPGLRRAEPREVIDADTLLHPALQALFNLWKARARGGVVRRGDIDVLELAPWLGWLILVEVLPPDGELICRVHGTCIAERFGYDMTGKPVLQHLQPRHRDRAIAEYRRVAQAGKPLAVHIEEQEGSAWVAWEKLMLPLWCRGPEVRQILAGLYPLAALKS